MRQAPQTRLRLPPGAENQRTTGEGAPRGFVGRQDVRGYRDRAQRPSAQKACAQKAWTPCQGARDPRGFHG
ncbi:hypothetical protein GCM10009825_05360 [Arthrobacter humicola]|uniref:Uncharacterized protein n=1 Tax=Arthrobacter humicola TaxID=409291 RepID=A0ABP5K532_9MICC